jgi:hypothetical protein
MGGFQSTMGTFTNKVYTNFLFLHRIFSLFDRMNCPKLTPPAILLSDEEQKIWEQAEVIQEKNTELVEAILARYGFTEVKFCVQSIEFLISYLKGIFHIK